MWHRATLLAFALSGRSSGLPEAVCDTEHGGCAADNSALLQYSRHFRQVRQHQDPSEDEPANRKLLEGKSYYFIPVDRFANPTNSSPCNNDNSWCGGMIKGITEHLDYIQGMGFDCIWITPVVKQYDGPPTPSGTGCMGYWAYNLYEIDPHFGTPEDLKNLVSALHERGMCLMQDFVGNHMGPIHSAADTRNIVPFNDPKYYHQLFIGDMSFDEYTQKSSDWPPPAQAMWSQSGAQCAPVGRSCNCYTCSEPVTGFGAQCTAEMVFDPTSPCPAGALSPYCMPGDYACEGYNETITQEGWFYDLGDLNQSDPFVAQKQLEWIDWYVREYDIDVLRLDTAAFMSFDFLSELQAAAVVPIIGEVTTTNLTFHANFQRNPPVPDGQQVLAGVLNFPIYYTAQSAFCGTWFPFSQNNLQFLGQRLKEQSSAPYQNLDRLGNFIDNHDVARVAQVCNSDRSKIANTLAFTMFSQGLPIVYYGTEELFTNQREALWSYGFNTETQFYKLIRDYNRVRRDASIALASMMVHEMEDPSLLAFSRGCSTPGQGCLLVLLNNHAAQETPVSYPIDFPFAPPNTIWVDALTGEPMRVDENNRVVAESTFPKLFTLQEVEVPPEEPTTEAPVPALWDACGTHPGYYCCDPNVQDPPQYCRTGSRCGFCGNDAGSGLLNHCECDGQSP